MGRGGGRKQAVATCLGWRWRGKYLNGGREERKGEGGVQGETEGEGEGYCQTRPPSAESLSLGSCGAYPTAAKCVCGGGGERVFLMFLY